MIRERKLEELGFTVSEIAKPLANYAPGVVSGNYVYVSGQLPLVKGTLICSGKLGGERSTEEGYEAAQICALNGINVLKSLVGDLDKVRRIVKIVGFVNCTPEFTDQPKVVNGASDLFGQVFGEDGIHARSAVGVASLPMGASCEVELIAEVQW